MHRPHLSLVLFIFFTIGARGAFAQTPASPDVVWADFMAWFKTAPAGANPVVGYVAKLQGDGTPEAEADRRAGIIMGLIPKRHDWVAVHFDKVYGQPVTGEPERDGFSAEPSALLAEVAKGLTAGTALDADMGQGRNAVYLAGLGWTVTGFDISERAVAAAHANAQAAGVTLAAVTAAYDDFDFGRDRWDLIVLAFAWAPVADPAFVTRLHTSLRAEGRVVFALRTGRGSPTRGSGQGTRANSTTDTLRSFFNRPVRIDRWDRRLGRPGLAPGADGGHQETVAPGLKTRPPRRDSCRV